jgi:SAM-dependent methyltransferase
MTKYYSKFLSAERLKLCYDLASQRILQYLEAEIDFVSGKIGDGDFVLELGCGYGRVLEAINQETKYLVGIDLSLENLRFAQDEFLSSGNPILSAMDAFQLGFKPEVFDLVFCIQNGISAIGGDARLLIQEAIRITKPGGLVIFSSYSDKFWTHRLQWFQIQSKNGLVGEIDYDLSGDGIIVCKDGFKATTFTEDKFRLLLTDLDNDFKFYEVDESSIFCEILV